MAFTKEAGRTPTEVGEIRVDLMTDPNAGPPINGPTQSITYRVEVIFSDSSVEWRRGNLAPELTPTQITQLQNFMAAMRTKAVAEFIG